MIGSCIRRFAAGALLGAAGSFPMTCATLGQQIRYAPAPVTSLAPRPKPKTLRGSAAPDIKSFKD